MVCLHRAIETRNGASVGLSNPYGYAAALLRDHGLLIESSGAEGRWAFEMMMAIYQSHREGGRRVELPLADRRHPLEVCQTVA